MNGMVLWSANNGQHPSRQLAMSAVLFSAQGVSPLEDDRPLGNTDALLVSPVRRTGDALGIVLVPGGLKQPARRNGISLPCGLHVLRHADRLELSNECLWVSAAGSAEKTTYDPAIHGQDVFCLRSKARLTLGDRIVICPGREGAECGAVYKVTAWNIGAPCHQCGFDPGAPQWKPPQSSQRSSLDALLQFARQ